MVCNYPTGPHTNNPNTDPLRKKKKEIKLYLFFGLLVVVIVVDISAQYKPSQIGIGGSIYS